MSNSTGARERERFKVPPNTNRSFRGRLKHRNMTYRYSLLITICETSNQVWSAFCRTHESNQIMVGWQEFISIYPYP